MELTDAREKMTRALTLLADELATIRTGRATPALVEKIMVEAYETRMPLMELATISAPEPDQLVITPFDQNVLKNIYQALSDRRELRLSPVIEENIIRIKIPPLTAERREELIKQLSQKLETGRIAIRQVRQNKRMELKRAFEEGQMTEDEKFKLEKELQELTDEFMAKIEAMGKQKETELRVL